MDFKKHEERARNTKSIVETEAKGLKAWKLNEAFRYYIEASQMGVEVPDYDTEVMWKGEEDGTEYPYRVVGMLPRGRKYKVMLRGMSGTEEKAPLSVFENKVEESK